MCSNQRKGGGRCVFIKGRNGERSVLISGNWKDGGYLIYRKDRGRCFLIRGRMGESVS